MLVGGTLMNCSSDNNNKFVNQLMITRDIDSMSITCTAKIFFLI